MSQWPAYYNEHDDFMADWLGELIRDGLIAPGEVDRRSIEDVTPDDLRPFRQCHFFAGAGVWSLAARGAGIPDHAPLWTGSCPCQPFSTTGEGVGFADERHLWPAFHYLIEQCGPALVTGEQVTGAGGDAWLDLVSADMDATGYGFGAAETCAAGFGAPHERSRNYWVAHRLGARLEGLARHVDRRDQPGWVSAGPARSVGPRRVPLHPARGERPGPVNGFWRDADWLSFRDGRSRPVEPGTFPLVDARTLRNRVGLLRGAGNACTIGQAQGFLEAVLRSIK